MESSTTKGTLRVAMVGNPNTGRTTLFNRLTGASASTGNYPRVTVNIESRHIQYQGWDIELIDLPGINSLSCRTDEELAARQFLFEEPLDLILNVIDMGNMERNLLLTSQLIEMGIPRIYALNLKSEAAHKGVRIDTTAMTKILNGPVVEIEGRTGDGIETLLNALTSCADAGCQNCSVEACRGGSVKIGYDDHLEEAIERIDAAIARLHPNVMDSSQSRWLAIKLLEGDNTLLKQEQEHRELMAMVANERQLLEEQHGEDAEIMLNDGRYGFVNGLLKEVSELDLDVALNRIDVTRVIDSVLLHRYLGLPLFFFVMWVMFEATFTLGTYPMEWIDALVGWVSAGVGAILPESLFRDMMVDGILAGVGGTIIFLPNIVILFFFIAFLSESGYLARSAFLIDRVMHSFGLHGKAFIPMITGFGCNVPAIMATRTIENRKDRLVAMLVTPFMSCSARLPVFILFSSAFFTENAGVVLFGLYSASIVLALLVAVVLSKTVVKGANSAPLLMELPPYRKPTYQSIMIHMGSNALEFLKKVGGIIVIGSVIIWFLETFPQNVPLSQDYEAQIVQLQSQSASEAIEQQINTLQQQQQAEIYHNRYLGQIGRVVEPIFAPLGFDLNASIALLTGFVAKEVIVATFGVLNAKGGEVTESDEGLRESIAQSMDPVSAIAFMVFVLLYMPCFATLAILYRETASLRWTLFSVGMSMGIAYLLALSISVIGGLYL
ncbi:ferrous iron transport protein B [Ectothiorhodospiraceae bacterium BW-2]|nr:ferrous iron transport protein B [Ectothiorhodospiraceae bacterium BW-2]